VQSPHAAAFLNKELEAFRASLETWLGRKIKDQAIAEAIEVYNRNRELLWRVYELADNDVAYYSALRRMGVQLKKTIS
jgi:benzoyl-CoA reductase/2-hydroxyglutaryl-CoA dehydratase subunit BcrC/BadD/HgdB